MKYNTFFVSQDLPEKICITNEFTTHINIGLP